MPLRDMILPEFDHEMAGTRRTLERVPDGKFEWRPHDKSFTMGQLASHLANIPSWMEMTLKDDSFDVAPGGEDGFKTPQAASAAELVQFFDTNLATGRKALESVSDEDMMKPWSLLANGETIFTMPRIAVLRSFILSHNVHHRAQLGVYLRINDVAVPALYGPSADEQ